MGERRVAVVTGASRGIGAATARALADDGHDLVLMAPESEREDLDQLSAALGERGARCRVAPCDLEEIENSMTALERAARAFERLDVLVNNAATRELCTMRSASLEGWERTVRVGLTAPAFLARTAAPWMEARGRGVIVNVSSVQSTLPSGTAPAYIASKGGLESLTYELAALYGPAGVRVLAVRPGAVDSGMSRDLASDDDVQAAARRDTEDTIPLRRWARPEEIGATIALLSRDACAYLTGTAVTVDGGLAHQLGRYSLKARLHPGEFTG
jgi:3-oxoacyl-[acyl-carrier protein] reductase